MEQQQQIEWRACEGFVGVQVSNTGLVTKNGKLASQVNDNGYLVVFLNGKYRKVHRLVAAAFCGKPSNSTVVNHLDGSRNNNTAENLEWTSPAGNTQHAAETGLIASGSRQGNTTLTEETVLQIDALLREGVAPGQVAARMGVSNEVVSKIKAGRTWGKVTGRVLAPTERKGAGGKTKLTADQVADTRRRVAAGMGIRTLARELGVGHNAIGAIIRGETWKENN